MNNKTVTVLYYWIPLSYDVKNYADLGGRLSTLAENISDFVNYLCLLIPDA